MSNQVKKAELADLRSGQEFDSRFGPVRLLNDGNGKRQKFNVLVIATGEVEFVRYSQLRRQVIELTEGDMEPERVAAIAIPPVIRKPRGLTVTQALWLEACRTGNGRKTHQAAPWTAIQRLAAVGWGVGFVSLHLIILSLS